MEIVIASKNKGKIKEIKGYTDWPGIKWLTCEEFPEIEESGSSFLDNAMIKAKALSGSTGKDTLADDSGLIVDAIGGRPGIYSSRYAGPGASDKENRDKLLAELEGIKDPEKRSAKFVCSMVLWDPDKGLVFKTDGVCEGRIGFEEKGSGGFGYDCIFTPAGFDMTMAELERSEKNRISHRGRALSDLFHFIVKK